MPPITPTPPLITRRVAYKGLADAYKKTEGDSHNPDFVAGYAAAELAQMILDLENSLENATSLAFSTSATSHTPLPSTLLLFGSSLLAVRGLAEVQERQLTAFPLDTLKAASITALPFPFLVHSELLAGYDTHQ